MRKLFFFTICITLLSSCVSKKDILYLQNLEQNISLDQQDQYKSIIKSDDLIRIIVSSENMMAVKDFNLYVSPVLQSSLQTQGQQQLFGYLVDNDGFIEFPILGSIKLEGLTLQEGVNLIKEKVALYVSDPISVDLRILNYKITILGEVNAPGTYTMQSNKTTILQAIGYAGDLTIYGNRKTVTVVRETSEGKISHKIDLTSSDFIGDDFYYLQQNDIVVVHPNNAQVQSAGFNRNAPLFVSIASLILSIIIIISRN